ncbi:MAG: YtxH domain-containing protein [Paludibacteraceae bacterium]
MKLSHIFAFVGGALAGVAVGMLLAPESGAETRQKIADVLHEKGITLDKEQFKQFVDKVIAKLKNGFTDAELHDAVNETINEHGHE